MNYNNILKFVLTVNLFISFNAFSKTELQLWHGFSGVTADELNTLVKKILITRKLNIM